MESGGESVRLEKAGTPPDTVSREELREALKIAVDEYRFEVTLNWQRTQYYLALNAALVTAGAGLLKVGGVFGAPLTAVVFGLAFATARIARRAVLRGHQYYRQAVYKKTLIEHLLGRDRVIDGFEFGGANLSVATTGGMREVQSILDDPERWIHHESGPHTVTSGLLRLFELFMVADAAGVLFTLAYAANELHWLG